MPWSSRSPTFASKNEDRRAAVAPLVRCSGSSRRRSTTRRRMRSTWSLPWYGLVDGRAAEDDVVGERAPTAATSSRLDRRPNGMDVMRASSASLTRLSASSFSCRASHAGTRRRASCRASAAASAESSRSASFLTGTRRASASPSAPSRRRPRRSDTSSSTASSRPAISAAVLGDVVRRDADRLPSRREHDAVLGLEHEPVGRRAGVAARAAVGEERAFAPAHSPALSICARCSLPRVVDVDRLPLGEHVERRLARLAVAVAGLLHPAERQVHLGAGRAGVDVRDARSGGRASP